MSINAKKELPPYPNGWYVVGYSDELPPGGIVTRRFMGQEVVLFRTRAGVASAVDPVCPHLGAHLGYGSTVEGETIRCAMHGFCFTTQGVCVATGYGTNPPPKAIVHAWPLCEKNNLILLYYDASGAAPTWEVPEVDPVGWTPQRRELWTLRSHPQETSENALDLGHLMVVHGYQSVHILRNLATQGPNLSVRYSMHRPSRFIGFSLPRIDVEFEITQCGLGYSRVDIHVPRYDIDLRLFVCATPVEPDLIDLHVALSMKQLADPGRISPLLWLVPRPLLNRVMNRAMFREIAHDLWQDFDIWEHKSFVQPMYLAEGDGPVGAFRQWARQFYPAPA